MGRLVLHYLKALGCIAVGKNLDNVYAGSSAEAEAHVAATAYELALGCYLLTGSIVYGHIVVTVFTYFEEENVIYCVGAEITVCVNAFD